MDSWLSPRQPRADNAGEITRRAHQRKTDSRVIHRLDAERGKESFERGGARLLGIGSPQRLRAAQQRCKGRGETRADTRIKDAAHTVYDVGRSNRALLFDPPIRGIIPHPHRVISQFEFPDEPIL